MAVKGMSSEVAVVQRISTGDTVFVGALAGMVGGVLVAAFAAFAAVANGMDILSPARMIGATFLGVGALEGGTAVIVYGLLLHLMTAMAWGVLYAALLPREASTGAALVGGLVYGLLVMLVMLYVVLPLVNPVMRGAVDGTSSFVVEHLIYGAALALIPVLRRRFAVRDA